jgi:hypothetical protein
VPFFVVGVSGINFYATDASNVVATADVDVLLAPRVEALRTALAALDAAGFSFQAGGEPILGRVLVRAKERAGRPKDVEFLRLYAARLREQAGAG